MPYAPVYTDAIYQLGDFYSYALPVLAEINDAVNGGGTGPGSPFYVKSTPGEIKDFIVIATGSSGDGVTTNSAGFNDAYATPNSSGIRDFSTFNAAGIGYPGDPGGGGFASGVDSPDHWDADIAALRSFLGGQKALFMFNHNQTKSGSGTDQDLWAWGQLKLTGPGKPDILLDFTLNDDKGQTLPLDPIYYSNTRGEMHSTGTPFPDPFDPDTTGTWPYGLANPADESGDWVHSPGLINIPSLGISNLSLNLGADQAAYAVYSPELQAILDNPASGYTHMRATFRLTGLNNGYEQLFIMPGEISGPIVVPTPVPLPSAAWMGLAMLGGIGGYHAMRRRAAAR